MRTATCYLSCIFRSLTGECARSLECAMLTRRIQSRIQSGQPQVQSLRASVALVALGPLADIMAPQATDEKRAFPKKVSPTVDQHRMQLTRTTQNKCTALAKSWADGPNKVQPTEWGTYGYTGDSDCRFEG